MASYGYTYGGYTRSSTVKYSYGTERYIVRTGGIGHVDDDAKQPWTTQYGYGDDEPFQHIYAAPGKEYRPGSPVKDNRYGSPVKDYSYGSPSSNNGHVHRGPASPQAVADRRFGYPADSLQKTNAAPPSKAFDNRKSTYPQQFQPSHVSDAAPKSNYPTDYGVHQYVHHPQPQPPVSDNRKFGYHPTDGQLANNGVHQHPPPPPPHSSGYRRYGYPRKGAFDDSDQDEDDGDESDGGYYPPGAAYYHQKRPVYGQPDHKTQEYLIRPINTAPRYSTTYPGPTSPTSAVQFNPTSYPRPNSPIRAIQLNPTAYPGPNSPTRAATSNPTTYPGPTSQPGGYVPNSKNSSSGNPIFNKFRDLYLENLGKPTPSTKNTEDDYKKYSSRPLTKPTDDVDSAVVHFLSEGLNLTDEHPGPTSKPLSQPVGVVPPSRKNHIDHPSPVSSPRKNRPDHYSGSLTSEPAKDGKYSLLPNMSKGKDDQRKFSVPLPYSKAAAGEAGHTAPNVPMEGNNNQKLSNVMANTTKLENFKPPPQPILSSLRTTSNNIQPPEQFAGSPKPSTYKQNGSSGDLKHQRTMNTKEAVEKYNGAFVPPPTYSK